MILGTMYETGHGVYRDLYKACDLFQLAADAGHRIAAFRWLMIYRTGVGRGVCRNKLTELLQILYEGPPPLTLL